ncbi:capreomycidine synthase [Catellatospora tritici]|uniref:capreomycidine synthase n=1 Tax=Catellatospora tritici TaxID=2851566 RepID=UPI001C2D038B|nr:capreomycidine synthase [Catellatospora tritici]MBV1850521.1 capreomycidine synthase [Catellatospora tritici]
MRLGRAALEDWMREFYFATTIDLGSSGVECWSVGELRRLLGITHEDLDRLTFDDSETYGSPGLRRALAGRFTGGDVDRVFATHGSTEAIFLAMSTLLDPGDEVVVVSPGYHSLSSIALSIGCRVVPWRLREDDGFTPDLDELRELVTTRTRMVSVNFPNNPTGASLTQPQFEQLLDIVAESGAYLVWDGAFTELTYDTRPLPEPSLRYERCLSIGTMSKAYGMPGTRVGWCLGAPDLLARFLPQRDALTICLSPLTQFFAERAIDHADLLVTMRREQARTNLGVLATWMAEHEELVSWTPPTGGCTAFPRFERSPDADELCTRLGRESSVLLVPGSCFGHPRHARLGFGGPADAFRTGLDRLSRTLTTGGATRGSRPETDCGVP